MNKSYSPEINFILEALRFFIHRDAGAIDQFIQKLNAITDWEAVIALASRHRILPFITLALDRANILNQVPASNRSFMESDIQQAVLDNVAKMAEFKKYNRLFEEAGIPVIPLKGVAQTQMIYRETPVRRMGDIDILVRDSDLTKCKQLLKANGFYFLNPLANLWQIDVLVQVLGRSSYIKGNLDIDLQWRPRFQIGDTSAEWNLNGAWENATPCPELGPNVCLLSPKHQAQHLLLEITGDFDRGYLIFFQLVGLTLMMHKFNLNAGDILDIGGKLNSDAKRRIEIMLNAVCETLIQPCKTEHWSAESVDTVRAIFESDLDPEAMMGWPAKMVLEAPVSWPARIVFFAGYLFPRTEYIRQKYGSGFTNWTKGYIGHWVRLAGKAHHFFLRKGSCVSRRAVQ